jgi:DDE superfamily endonuclease
MTWTQLHSTWDFDIWKRVDWTDEAMFRIGGFGDVWVTRRAEEKYDLSCCVPKFRHRSGLIIHAAISGVSKRSLVIFEEKEKVPQKYSTRVLSGIHRHIRTMERQEIGFMRRILIEDNAFVHTAIYTRTWHAYYGFNKMVWPANLPDLNLIENVRRLLKHRIGRRKPHTIKELRQYLYKE